jgi:hypothetical protein
MEECCQTGNIKYSPINKIMLSETSLKIGKKSPDKSTVINAYWLR